MLTFFPFHFHSFLKMTKALHTFHPALYSHKKIMTNLFSIVALGFGTTF